MNSVDKSREYQKMYKGMRYNIKEGKRVVFVIPEDVKVDGVQPIETIYGMNIFVFPSREAESGLLEARNSGLVIYISSEIHHEFEKLLKSFNIPLVYIRVGKNLEEKQETGAIFEFNMPGVNKTSIKYVVNNLIEMYKSVDKEIKKYRSTGVKESTKLVSTNEDGRASGYSMSRLPYRSRLAKGLLPEKNRKQKA